MKILLIDDELSNVKMLEAMLKISGYQCDPYTNSKEAWLALSTTPEQYNLILADRIMPHLNALQLLELVKKEIGLDLKVDSDQELKSLSQIQLSKLSNQAKALLSNAYAIKSSILLLLLLQKSHSLLP